ncbi:hypothetical protein FOH10_17570 [Nocardia otitidiscaviarum]|uniref:Uncharacterized protein n=1 Tax=Nocardia otitidiscaviarum TaxID=1823 RepID=A0A516NMX8_9NOCA|nr:hypothetical protein [Nocardia otitidiscaviarum]MCP9624493.1 hypothetical protein [Nocardia otitidiscaviarum]QDP80250.1 hypothetical protein FOH10_17570 [Nocardia otitidiscaviarum]
MTGTSPARYDRSVLLGAYLDAVGEFSTLGGKTGVEAEAAYASWSPDAVIRSKAHLAYLAGLEKLFGVDLGLPDPMSGSGDMRRRVLLTLLLKAARSYRAIGTPLDGYMEASLLVRAMEDAGIADAVTDGCARMQSPARTLRQQHLEVLDTVLAGLLGERADASYELDDPVAAEIVVPEPWDPWAV